MTQQKNTRFRVNSQTDRLPTLTAIHRRAGMIAVLLIALTLMGSLSFADTPGGNLSPVDGATLVTLKDGRRISLETLWAKNRGGSTTGISQIAARTEKELYSHYMKAQMDAELAAQQKEEAELDAALAQTKAMSAALDEVTDTPLLLDFSKKAQQRRKELAAILDAGLNNPLLFGKETSKGARAMLQALADLMREGKSPAQMDPKLLEEIKRTVAQEKQTRAAEKP